MMNRTIIIPICKGILAAGFLLILTGSCASPNHPPPNIIFLMDDQHRWDALGFIDPEVQTPTLNFLAREGIFFDQAVCQAPMCVPSRYSMMLGLYPNQIGVFSNAKGLLDHELPAIPLPQVLKDAGYQTAGFGKTHWRADPISTRGFEIRYTDNLYEEGAILMSDTDPEAYKQYMEETEEYGGGEENNLGYIGRTSEVPEENHRDGWVFNRCMDFIDHGLDNDRPLFLYLSFLKPHAAHNVPAGYEELYDIKNTPVTAQPPWEKDHSPHAAGLNRREMYENFWKTADKQLWKEMKLRYWANCTWIDDMFGRTLSKLEDKGILDNALIVYVSDHGEMLGERYYRFNKYCLYESSVRVPVILSGSSIPDHLRNTIDHRPAQLVDIYPTILQTVGIEVPQGSVGLNLTGTEQHPAGFSALHQHPEQASFMWRTPDYKLILVMNRKKLAGDYQESDIIDGELYNLSKDPMEWENIYKEQHEKDILEKMTEELLAHLATL